jgi:hypothetical protein
MKTNSSATACIEILETRIAPAAVAAINLGDLDGADGFKLSGAADDDNVGHSVSAAGDVNGDGFGDFIVGAYMASAGGTHRGAAYVVFGKAGGFPAGIVSSSLDGSNGFQLAGVTDDDYAGNCVSAAGDINGDGFADVVVAAEKAAEGGTGRGAIYVVFGKASGFGASVALSTLDGTNGFKLSGVADGAYAGNAVSAAGDINGDGFGDLIVGGRLADEGGPQRGAVYVVFGKAGGFDASTVLSALDGSNGFKISGVADRDYAGSSVSAAGDVNGDGFGDFIFGAYGADAGAGNSGAAYVIFGKAGGFGASVALSGLNGTNGFKLLGVEANDALGLSVSAAGDVNGDGFGDVIVGADQADAGGSDRGAAYVIFGKASAFDPNTTLDALDGSDGF